MARRMQDAGLALMLRHGIVGACPSCHVLIEKNGGCNHVACSACGAFFDWGTGAALSA